MKDGNSMDYELFMDEGEGITHEYVEVSDFCVELARVYKNGVLIREYPEALRRAELNKD